MIRRLAALLALIGLALQPLHAQQIVGRPMAVQAVKPGLRLVAAVVSGNLAPVGSTFCGVGDGIASEAAAIAERNYMQWFLALMSGRLQPLPAYNIAQSGTMIAVQDASNYPFIAVGTAACAAQKPDVAIFGSMGHNDGLLDRDPAGGTTRLQDWRDALLAHVNANPQALLIPVLTTFPSIIAGETTVDSGQTLTRRQRASNAQIAYANSLGDPRIVIVDLSGLDPTNLSPASDSGRVHPDDRGAIAIAQLMVAAIGPKVTAATRAEVQALIDAGTYPLMGTQLDGDRALAGTGGTITGPGVSGSIATSKAIVNGTGSTGITVAMQSNGVTGRQKIVLGLGGTTSTEAFVQVSDKANWAPGAVPVGSYVMQAWGLTMPGAVGMNRFGADWNGGLFGSAFGNGNPAANTTLSGNLGRSLDTVVLVAPRPTFGSGAPSSKRNIGFRFPASTALSGTIEIDQPAAWIVNNRTRHAPVYLGDVKPTGGGSYVYGNNLRARPTGTITQASGGTIRVEPGLVAPAGLLEADYAAKRIYRGTSSDTAIGSGTLMATITTAGTWSQTFGAAAATTGQLIYVEYDVSNGVGGTLTVRSTLTVTVG